MSITFNCEADVILWAFSKLLIIFGERRYTFALHCIWWLASLVQLDTALRYLIEHHQFPSENRETQNNKIDRQISPIPRDIARDSSVRSDRSIPRKPIDSYISDPLRRTRKGRVNPRPETKKQLKKARRERARQIQQQVNKKIKA